MKTWDFKTKRSTKLKLGRRSLSLEEISQTIHVWLRGRFHSKRTCKMPTKSWLVQVRIRILLGVCYFKRHNETLMIKVFFVFLLSSILFLEIVLLVKVYWSSLWFIWQTSSKRERTDRVIHSNASVITFNRVSVCELTFSWSFDKVRLSRSKLNYLKGKRQYCINCSGA